jgi:hypothetical protein
MRALLKLKKGDVVTLVNHTSSFGNVYLADNAGGTLVSDNASVVLYKVAPYWCDDDDDDEEPIPHTKPVVASVVPVPVVTATPSTPALVVPSKNVKSQVKDAIQKQRP